MKKKAVIVLCVLCSFYFFSGCSQSKNVSSSKIITSFFAVKSHSGTRYSFYVSKPKSGEENSPPEEGAIMKTVVSSDFETALNEFEESFGKYDMTHLNSIFLDDGYLSEQFSKDLPAIRKHIRISPTVKCFALNESPQDVADCINKTYNSSFEEFMESAWRNERKKLLCTLSELAFSIENPIYTASMPVIEISDSDAIRANAFIFYNTKWGVMRATDKDYELYSDHLKKYGKTSKAIKIYPDTEIIKVKIPSSEKYKREITDMANKYTALGFDFMNVFYYTKKFFPDYKSYFGYIENMDHTNIRYE
ncbi:MAG: hypothetical protein E7394_05320 [Ruminococcaceae bacterium]|nr:hypothetical protein [Oscillospiraceae bacterium]